MNPLTCDLAGLDREQLLYVLKEVKFLWDSSRTMSCKWRQLDEAGLRDMIQLVRRNLRESRLWRDQDSRGETIAEPIVFASDIYQNRPGRRGWRVQRKGGPQS